MVNCSGRNFDKDPKVKIIRGQTVLVQQQYRKTVTRQSSDGSWSFLIPRPSGGGTIVGGSKEVGDFETRARPETRNALLRQAVKNFPDFVADITDFVVVQDNVGRRPWREGGLRIRARSDGRWTCDSPRLWCWWSRIRAQLGSFKGNRRPCRDAIEAASFAVATPRRVSQVYEEASCP